MSRQMMMMKLFQQFFLFASMDVKYVCVDISIVLLIIHVQHSEKNWKKKLSLSVDDDDHLNYFLPKAGNKQNSVHDVSSTTNTIITKWNFNFFSTLRCYYSVCKALYSKKTLCWMSWLLTTENNIKVFRVWLYWRHLYFCKVDFASFSRNLNTLIAVMTSY